MTLIIQSPSPKMNITIAYVIGTEMPSVTFTTATGKVISIYQSSSTLVFDEYARTPRTEFHREHAYSGVTVVITGGISMSCIYAQRLLLRLLLNGYFIDLRLASLPCDLVTWLWYSVVTFAVTPSSDNCDLLLPMTTRQPYIQQFKDLGFTTCTYVYPKL